jgi:hypothetical protein
MNTFFAEDGTVEARGFNRAAYDVANFFAESATSTGAGCCAESVWHTFGIPTRVYWTVYGPTIRKMREEQNDPTVYEGFERLDLLVADLSSERGIPPPTRARLRRILVLRSARGRRWQLLCGVVGQKALFG